MAIWHGRCPVVYVLATGLPKPPFNFWAEGYSFYAGLVLPNVPSPLHPRQTYGASLEMFARQWPASFEKFGLSSARFDAGAIFLGLNRAGDGAGC